MNDSSRRSRVWRLLAVLSPLVQLKLITPKEARIAADAWVNGDNTPILTIAANVSDTKYRSIADQVMEFSKQ